VPGFERCSRQVLILTHSRDASKRVTISLESMSALRIPGGEADDTHRRCRHTWRTRRPRDAVRFHGRRDDVSRLLKQ
jgi:hypothetical protein